MAPALECRPVINSKGKEHECVYLNHFAVHQKLTQHCKSTILQLKKNNKNPRPDFKVCLSALLVIWFSQIRQKGIPINFTRQKTYGFMWKTCSSFNSMFQRTLKKTTTTLFTLEDFQTYLPVGQCLHHHVPITWFQWLWTDNQSSFIYIPNYFSHSTMRLS